MNGRTNIKQSTILDTIKKHKLLLLVPTIGFFAFSILYATLGPKKWKATQSLVVRDQLNGGNQMIPGRFESLESLKSAQETISEIARNPTVIRRTLENVELESIKIGKDGPSDQLVEQFQSSISVSAPGGSELGKTEMIDLHVVFGNKEDSKHAITTLIDEIENQLRTLRQEQATSMTLELRQGVELARKNLDAASKELQDIEKEVGADLAELRNLNNPFSGGSSLQSSLTSVRSEVRTANVEYDSVKRDLAFLQQAVDNPSAITSTPDEVLAFLPALKSLKEGLIQAQLAISTNLGRFTDEHPVIVSSKTTLAEIKRKIAEEVEPTLAAKKKSLELAKARVDRLKENEKNLMNRLKLISLRRVDYDGVFNIVQQRSNALTNAQNELDKMESMRLAAAKVSYVTRVDGPQVSTRPLGLGKKSIVGIGTLFGLLLGVGLVMFVATPSIADPNAVAVAPDAEFPYQPEDSNSNRGQTWTMPGDFEMDETGSSSSFESDELSFPPLTDQFNPDNSGEFTTDAEHPITDQIIIPQNEAEIPLDLESDQIVIPQAKPVSGVAGFFNMADISQEDSPAAIDSLTISENASISIEDDQSLSDDSLEFFRPDDSVTEASNGATELETSANTPESSASKTGRAAVSTVQLIEIIDQLKEAKDSDSENDQTPEDLPAESRMDENDPTAKTPHDVSAMIQEIKDETEFLERAIQDSDLPPNVKPLKSPAELFQQFDTGDEIIADDLKFGEAIDPSIDPPSDAAADLNEWSVSDADIAAAECDVQDLEGEKKMVPLAQAMPIDEDEKPIKPAGKKKKKNRKSSAAAEIADDKTLDLNAPENPNQNPIGNRSIFVFPVEPLDHEDNKPGDEE